MRYRVSFTRIQYHSLRRRVNRASVVEALQYVPGEAAYLALR
jgi:hypothetical protein